MAIVITHAERAAWQRRATNLLARLLTTFPSLPVISWTVGQTGPTLIGRCPVDDPATARTDFATWCAVLGAHPHPDHVNGGITHLRAITNDLDGVRIHLIADISEPDPQEAGHGAR